MSSRKTLIVSLLTAASMVAPTSYVLAKESKPTLVLNITVEGLSESNLDLLRDLFTKEGFNLLYDKGVTIPNVVYGPNIDATAAISMIATGAAPTYSNIPGDTRFDAQTLTSRPILEDARGQLSPAALAVSTLSDEIRIAEGGTNNVYSLAANPRQAVILAGHAGNAALWVNDVNGQWTSSSFYKDIPTSVTSTNYSTPLKSRLDTIRWAPALNVNAYPDIPQYKKTYPFKYSFLANDGNRYRAFMASPKGNEEIAREAGKLISALSLGKGEKTDMLSVAFTLAPYPYSKDFDSRLETLDAYVRLDQSLAALFKAVQDKGPGMDRTLVTLVGVPAPGYGKRDDERFNIPYGQFSVRKAASLLNVYLMALHGKGDWVAGFHNGQFHLNQKLISERDVDLQLIRRETAEFLKKMEGVCDAYTLNDILAGNPQTEAIRRNTAANYAGDVFVTIAPGWEVITDETATASARPMVSRLAATSYPAFLLIPNTEPATITGDIDACAIAPTVARLLRIRSPNAASATPIYIPKK